MFAWTTKMFFCSIKTSSFIDLFFFFNLSFFYDWKLIIAICSFPICYIYRVSQIINIHRRIMDKIIKEIDHQELYGSEKDMWCFDEFVILLVQHLYCGRCGPERHFSIKYRWFFSDEKFFVKNWTTFLCIMLGYSHRMMCNDIIRPWLSLIDEYIFGFLLIIRDAPQERAVGLIEKKKKGIRR